jgi:hypothetical protein
MRTEAYHKKKLPNGFYNTIHLKVEPMVAWATTTEFGIRIWTRNSITVIPSFESRDNRYQNILKKELSKIDVPADTPIVITFGPLVSNFTDFLQGPPQTNTILRLKTTSSSSSYCCHSSDNDVIVELNFKIPKYWAGPLQPNVPDFKFNINSCTKLVGDYETNEAVFPYSLFRLWSDYSKDADLNILLGDNIYLSEYQGDSNSGVVQRYLKLFDLDVLNGAWSVCPYSAVVDDHDLGINDVSLGAPSLNLLRRIFASMWPNNNENTISPVMWSFFRYDLSFIGLDSRSFSTEPGNPTSTILGKNQLEWLRQTFFTIKKLYENSFVFISTGIPFVRPRSSYFSNYPHDQRAIIDMIKEFNLKNVIFLTGSAHFSDISKADIGNGLFVTEFINSPMGTIPRDAEDYKRFPPNPYLVPGTLLLNENNFGSIRVTGNYGRRKLEYKVVKPNGTIAYTYVMDQQI